MINDHLTREFRLPSGKIAFIYSVEDSDNKLLESYLLVGSKSTRPSFHYKITRGDQDIKTIFITLTKINDIINFETIEIWSLIYFYLLDAAVDNIIVLSTSLTSSEDRYAQFTSITDGLDISTFLWYDYTKDYLFTTREGFFQISPNDFAWLATSSDAILLPEINMLESAIPCRPPRPSQGTLLYSRYIHSISKLFTLNVVHLEQDLVEFHNWMNESRVDRFWGEAGDIDKHHSYLSGILSDRHVIPTIGSLDGEKFLYVGR